MGGPAFSRLQAVNDSFRRIAAAPGPNRGEDSAR